MVGLCPPILPWAFAPLARTPLVTQKEGQEYKGRLNELMSPWRVGITAKLQCCPYNLSHPDVMHRTNFRNTFDDSPITYDYRTTGRQLIVKGATCNTAIGHMPMNNTWPDSNAVFIMPVHWTDFTKMFFNAFLQFVRGFLWQWLFVIDLHIL